jgi:hypothetical protein
MARAGAGYTAGSRPQKKYTHIPSHSRGSTGICGFDQKKQKQPAVFNNPSPRTRSGVHFCLLQENGFRVRCMNAPYVARAQGCA